MIETNELLDCLDYRRRIAFELRSEGKTYKEIGQELGISGNRAMQLFNSSIRLIRRRKNAIEWRESVLI